MIKKIKKKFFEKISQGSPLTTFYENFEYYY